MSIPKPQIESRFEHGLFAARWLMAPMYVGLVFALVQLLIIFVREAVHYAALAFVMDADEVILAVLTLIDLTLAGNLLLIVLYSGYETFVSKLELPDVVDRPGWLGTVDFSGLKMKLLASIVAISAIHLLKRFMEIGETSEPFDATELRWMVIVHLTFVGSGVLLALMDWITARSDRH